MENIENILRKIIFTVMIIVASILIFNQYDISHNQKKGTTTSMFSQIIFKGVPKIFKEIFNSGIKQEIKEGYQIIKTDIKEGNNGIYNDVDSTKINLKKINNEKNIESEDGLVSVEPATEKELREYNIYIEKN
jgi:hypothetical protein